VSQFRGCILCIQRLSENCPNSKDPSNATEHVTTTTYNPFSSCFSNLTHAHGVAFAMLFKPTAWATGKLQNWDELCFIVILWGFYLEVFGNGLQSARLGQLYYLFCYGLNPKLSPKCLKKSTWPNNIPRVFGNIDGTLILVVRPGVN